MLAGINQGEGAGLEEDEATVGLVFTAIRGIFGGLIAAVFLNVSPLSLYQNPQESVRNEI